jgi:predicted dehydrogenase
MVEACHHAGVILRVAFQIRLEALLQRVREIVASGALGELRLVTFERTARIDQPGAWRSDPAQGGILYDVATHLLDLIPWMTGARYEEVFAFSHPDRRENVSEDTISIIARMSGGLTANVRASRELPFAKNDLIIEGTRGMVSTSGVRWLDEYWLRIEDASGAREERIAPTAIYHREVEAMERELAGDRTVLPDGEEAIRMIGLAQAIFESIQSRHAVRVR